MWMSAAVEALRTQLAQDPKEAAKRFEKLSYCWNEIAMLPFMEDELAPHAEFHSSIAGWINVTYSDADRERLRPLAQRMGTDPKLEDWARRLLQERGYISGLPAKTWAEIVRVGNSRI